MTIPVKIITGDNQATGGLVDARMLKPLASEVVRVPDDLSELSVSGGVLPITQAEYDKLGIGFFLSLESGEDFLLEDGSLLLLE